MRISLLLLCLLTTTAHAEHNRLTPEQIADGWISLFDGETLFGWEEVNEADWQVVDGEIRVAEGERSWLMTTSRFSDYYLELEYRCPPETNSGIFFHSTKKPKDPKSDCFELNIAPRSDRFPTGMFVGREKQQQQFPLAYTKDDQFVNVDPWDGRWHTIRLEVSRYSRKLYGIATIHIDGLCYGVLRENSPAFGHIGLQHNSGPIAFRNVRLKPLGTKPIFNGKDLTGWNTDRAEASEFKVTPDSELQVLNGRGQIESEASYGDFVMQLECFVNGDALNSGVFFRCIPRDFMMGYECQIQNGYKDSDPTKPVDCGTGGFFRRQNARRIVANDREWFAMTLIADGPHMATWVNGQQVSDWTDTRPPHENPRKGLRLQPGTLAIQGHDPTTDLRFRNLKIVEMPAAEE